MSSQENLSYCRCHNSFGQVVSKSAWANDFCRLNACSQFREKAAIFRNSMRNINQIYNDIKNSYEKDLADDSLQINPLGSYIWARLQNMSNTSSYQSRLLRKSKNAYIKKTTSIAGWKYYKDEELPYPSMLETRVVITLFVEHLAKCKFYKDEIRQKKTGPEFILCRNCPAYFSSS